MVFAFFGRFTPTMANNPSPIDALEHYIPDGVSSHLHPMAKSGMVFNIMRFCQHDGPGIRTVVFLKGCPLRCIWCHNPEGLTPRPEIAFVEARCIQCGECYRVCPEGAVEKVGGEFRIVDRRCAACGTCVKTCYSDARQLVGREMTVEEVLSEVEKDTVYYDESGGGVTFSGGEPLQQHQFLSFLLLALKERGIHSAIETSGYTSTDVIAKFSKMVDLFLYDIKLMDDVRHRQFTGVSNTLILQNLKLLSTRGANTIVRMPVVPGINDDEQNIWKLTQFLMEETTVKEVHFLPFHRIGQDKYQRLRKASRFADSLPSPQMRVESLAGILESAGIRTVIGG